MHLQKRSTYTLSESPLLTIHAYIIPFDSSTEVKDSLVN